MVPSASSVKYSPTETEKVQGLNEKINLARQQVISQISFLKNQNASENTEKIKELEKKANELKKKLVPSQL